MAYIGHRDTGGNGVQGVSGIWPMRPTGGIGYRGMSHMGNRSHGQWGTWTMGLMGHGQWGPWAIGTFLLITSLILDGFLQKFNWT